MDSAEPPPDEGRRPDLLTDAVISQVQREMELETCLRDALAREEHLAREVRRRDDEIQRLERENATLRDRPVEKGPSTAEDGTSHHGDPRRWWRRWGAGGER